MKATFKIGDRVEATETITRRDGRSELKPGQKATIRSTWDGDDYQIVSIHALETGAPLIIDICCTTESPLKLATRT